MCLMDLEPGTVIDRYTVEGFLGEGGMAVVYRVRHNDLRTEHALKLLQVSSPSIKTRLIREGRVQAQLKHPNVVTVTDVVEYEGATGLVMDLVRGPTLYQLLAYNRLTVEQADTIAQGLLSGMRAAHEAGLIHRDLKPANVLLDTSEGRILPKIADFGLAKIATGGIRSTRSGVALGTPSYMAPEQIRSAKDVDHRADVFALGAILYELYGGVQAFKGKDVLEIYKRVTAGEYEPLVDHAPGLPDRVYQAVEGALQLAREQRFESVRSLMRVLLRERTGLAGEGTWDVSLLDSVRQISEEIPSLRPDLTVPPTHRRSWHPALIGAGLGVLGGLLVLAWVLGPSTRATPIAEVVDPAPPTVEPEPVAVVQPVRRPATPKARVRVVGDIPVELVAGERSFSPGVVPPGAYEVRALLEGKQMTLGQVVAVAGELVELRCSEAMMLCRAPAPMPVSAPQTAKEVWEDPVQEPVPEPVEPSPTDGEGSPWEDPGG